MEMKKLKEGEKASDNEVESKDNVPVEVFAKPLREPVVKASSVEPINRVQYNYQIDGAPFSNRNQLIAASGDNNNRANNIAQVPSPSEEGYNIRAHGAAIAFDNNNEPSAIKPSNSKPNDGEDGRLMNRGRENGNVKSLAEYRREKDLKFAEDSKRVYEVLSFVLLSF